MTSSLGTQRMGIELECRPKKLFKYISSKYVPSVLSGRFRVGTLYGYRSMEQNTEVGDDTEGMRQYILVDDRPRTTYEGLARFPVFRDLEVSNPEMPAQIKASMKEGWPVAIVQHALDCFIYCMTSEFDEAVMRSFDCDACLQIDDPIGFFRALSVPMEQHAVFGVMSECVYTDKFAPITEHDHTKRTQVIKSRSYAHQKEVRFLWDTRKTNHQTAPNLSNLKPIFIRSPKAATFLKRIC